ncbi:hypothetical protein HDU82_004499 [Entophlyctis luteolus]|nr:hypothetical protein HDU82_004499 [Entophlyctis luteolus]
MNTEAASDAAVESSWIPGFAITTEAINEQSLRGRTSPTLSTDGAGKPHRHAPRSGTLDPAARERRCAQNRVSQKTYREKQAAYVKNLEARVAQCEAQHGHSRSVFAEVEALRLRVAALEAEIVVLRTAGRSGTLQSPAQFSNNQQSILRSMQEQQELLMPRFVSSGMLLPMADPFLFNVKSQTVPVDSLPKSINNSEFNFNLGFDFGVPSRTPILEEFLWEDVSEKESLTKLEEDWSANVVKYSSLPTSAREVLGRKMLKSLPSFSSDSGAAIVNEVCDLFDVIRFIHGVSSMHGFEVSDNGLSRAALGSITQS